MKNYPIFKKGNQNLFITWTNYLKELNSHFLDLYNFSEGGRPDYRENKVLEANDSPAITEQNEEGYFDISFIPYHQYVRTTKDYNIVLNGSIVDHSEAGDIILSRARAENEIDNQNATIKNDFNYYFIQPSSGGSYYVPSFEYDDNDNLYMVGTFDRYAEEKYGLIYDFAGEVYPTRYFLGNTVNRQSYGGSFPSLFKNPDGTTVRYIADKNTRLGFIKNKPTMGQLYIGDEPVYCDTVELLSKVERSNIGSYTMKNRENNNEWPEGIRLEVL